MGLLRISGKVPLSGTIQISGRKNAALKLIAASILSTEPVTLRRIPNIGDVRVMLEIIELLGARVQQEADRVTIDASSVHQTEIPYEMGRKLRASLVLVGPLLARFGKAKFPHPGGCVIGKRSIRPHLDAFEQLGAQIDFDGTWYSITAPEQGLEGREVYLKERSVTGTENLMMAACGAHGTTHIWNAAEETHIRNLADLLRAMGHSVTGDGTSQVSITAGSGIHSADIEVIPDEIEVGTFAVAALVTGGTIRMEGVGPKRDLLPILSKLDDFNALYEYDNDVLTVLPSPNLRAADVQTNPWPGFPPDLQSPFTVLATQAKGTSLIHDWMYEGRLYFVDLLQRMGAAIVTCDPHRAIVNGPTELIRSTSITPDLRAGAALVLAALAADGESVIEHVELIDRGYVALDERLRSLGATISRE